MDRFFLLAVSCHLSDCKYAMQCNLKYGICKIKVSCSILRRASIRTSVVSIFRQALVQNEINSWAWLKWHWKKKRSTFGIGLVNASSKIVTNKKETRIRPQLYILTLKVWQLKWAKLKCFWSRTLDYLAYDTLYLFTKTFESTSLFTSARTSMATSKYFFISL